MLRWLFGWFSLTLLFGCASYGSHLSATPIDPDQREISLNADGMIVDRGVGPQLLPNPEIGLRFGLMHDLDLGARLNAGSLAIDARLRAIESKVFDLSLVPGVGGGFVPVTNGDTGLCNANLFGSILGGLKLAPRSEIILGPRLISTYAFPLAAFSGDSTDARFIHYVGGMLGAKLPLGERSFLSPELNVLFPYDTARDEWFLPSVQGGLAIQFESRKKLTGHGH